MVARLTGYQMDEVSDHSSDREQERRQKRRHEEPPATADPPVIPPFPESGIPPPFTFVDLDDLFFSSVVPPDMCQQSLHFIVLLYEQTPILEQVIGGPRGREESTGPDEGDLPRGDGGETRGVPGLDGGSEALFHVPGTRADGA